MSISTPPAVRIALAALVLGDPPAAARAARELDALRDPDGWELAQRLAARWGVFAALAARASELDVPDAVRGSLLRRGLALRARTALVLRRAGETVAALEEAGVAAVAIKGVALLALDPAARDRATSDVDLVVAEEDAPAARRALRDAGYAELGPSFDLHIEQIARSAELHNFARTFVRDGVEIDLHWRFGVRPPKALRADGLFRRALRARLGDSDAWVVHPTDGALVSAHHALRGSFNPDNTVRDAGDLRRWATHPAFSAGAAAESAAESGLASTLLALCACALRRDPAAPLGPFRASLEAAADRAARDDAVPLARYVEDVIANGLPAALPCGLFAPRLSVKRLVRSSLRRALPRAVRIARQLFRFDALAGYRAVARTQRRL